MIIRFGTAGSSPLTRGKHVHSAGTVLTHGLIPAHAGKTGTVPVCRSSSRAHPRSRGENHARKVAKPGDKGSSPLTRGKPSASARYSAAAGLIPAHAGKTPTRTT